ncbi:DUF2017 family protein [uncultured Jatrophihabitans sp.]|uniref:DUF2017 family protein n=1 Tax=uncultured Jatrophihabitans sp. TaxID=1610747 RepID=UPI0035CB964E
MKLSGRPGKVKLHFEPAEVELLGVLLTELDEVVADEDADTEVGRRLYPAALPDDPDASRQFRELTEEALRSGRRERISACRAQLQDPPVPLDDEDVARSWLQVLNDLRLVLGTRLGVTEDGVPPPVSGPEETDDDAVAPYAIYDYLTGVQDLVVRALMR